MKKKEAGILSPGFGQQKKIGVIFHPEFMGVGQKRVMEGEIEEIVEEVFNLLRLEHCDLFFDPFAAKAMGESPTDIPDMDIDLALIFGGDGTILYSLSKLRRNPLILGINAGRVGYLSELSFQNASAGIKKVLLGEYDVDLRDKIEFVLKEKKYDALNEVAVFSAGFMNLMEFEVSLDHKFLCEFRADGVIISTQTGSTGHSLSAGGPVIHPRSQAFAITAVNPFMRSRPPYIVPDDAEISVKLKRKGRSGTVVCDGNAVGSLGFGDTVSVKKSGRKVKFVSIE